MKQTNEISRHAHAITIDGPAASGKSTVAKLLAKKMNFVHIDSGAMYRTLTFAFMQNLGMQETAVEFGRRFDKETQESINFEKLSCQFSIINGKQIYQVTGKDIGDCLHEPHLTQRICYIANHEKCRDQINHTIRSFLKETNLVVDGRDIGSVVFPETPFKFFMDADVSVRAKRRWEELQKTGHEISIAELQEEIKKRDESDRNRKLGALVRASDSVSIESSYHTPDEVVAVILAYLQIEF